MNKLKYPNIKACILLVIIVMGLTSCQKVNNPDNVVIYYKIENHSSFTIKVIANKFWDGNETLAVSFDTIVHYSSGESRDLLVVYGYERDFDFEKNVDTLQNIGSLKIYKNDTIPAAYKYNESKYWSYSKPATDKIQYTLEITNASFNR